MPRVIVIANQKGGVGKTTTTYNLGAALAERGKETVLVDLDPQAALTASCGYNPYKMSRSLYTVLMSEKASLLSILQPVSKHLHLAPGSVDLTRAEIAMTGATDRAYRLRKAIRRMRMQFDYILIDTPPSLGLLTVNGLVAADELLVPVQCQFLSMRGVRALLETVWLIHERLNPQLDLLGVLATMYRTQSEHSQDVVDELYSVFDDRVFPMVIEDQNSVAAAPAERTSVLNFDPDSPAANAYRELAAEIDND